jgi:hypothetical protein
MSTRANGKVTEISQAELSRRHGWSRSYTSKLVGQGKISTLPNGKIDPIQAEKELEANTGWTMHGRHGGSLEDEGDGLADRMRSLADEDGLVDLNDLSREDRQELFDRAMKQFAHAAGLVWVVGSDGTPLGSPPCSKGRATPGWWTRELMLEVVDGICRRSTRVKR